MSGVLAVFKRELASYFATPIAYVFIVIFLVLAGVFTFFYGGFYETGQADLSGFFYWHPWLYLFLVPALSMRLFSEDIRQRSFELLLSSPLTSTQIVLGKSLGLMGFIADRGMASRGRQIPRGLGVHGDLDRADVSDLDHRQLPGRPR